MQRSAFTLSNIAVNVLIIAFLFFINRLGELGNIVSLGCLAIMALTSVSGGIKALSVLALIIMANPFMVEKTSILLIFRFPLVALIGARILWDVFTKRPELLRLPHLNALLLFGAVCVILAPINGYFTMVAVMKATLFTYGAYIILIGTELNRSRMSDLTVWFTAIIIFISAVSYLSIPLGISHVFRGELLLSSMGVGGLSGITTHQQALGSFASISAVFCFALGVFSKLPKRWLFILLFFSFLPILIMTQSRTAVASLILSLLFIIAAAPFILKGRKAVFNKFRPMKWIAGGCILVFLGFFTDFASGGRIADRIMDFALKGLAGRVYTVEVEDLTATRMGLIEQSWRVFLDSPLTGLNFGTSTSPYFIQNASAFSAPTEKGFIPTAVLEEIGIIGAVFFIVFLFLLFRKLVQDENIIGFGVLAGFLIQNLGEMMFFSFGGAGLFSWSIVGAGIAVGYRHQFIRRV